MAYMLALYCQAAFSITLIGSEVDNRLNINNTGEYNVLLSHLLKEIDTEMEILPMAKALTAFADHSDCLFPTTITAIKQVRPKLKDIDLLESKPIDLVSSHFMRRPSDTIISTPDQLSGLTITTWLGVPLEKIYSDVSFDQNMVLDQTAALKKLYKERTDVILGFIPDTLIALEKLDFPLPVYDDQFIAVGAMSGITLVCKPSAENQQFINQFNDNLDQLKKNNQFKKIFSKHTRFPD